MPSNQTYIAAISGGVDSMVLLDLLIGKAEKCNWQIIVAHVDHGIRSDSLLDKQLVEQVANNHNLLFETTRLSLGPGSSEELARQQRYRFLEELASKYHASAIVTAHHQDDLIETAIINLIRGTGRKGLTSLIDNDSRLRPLIHYTKADIINYARQRSISWREDSSNTDESYLRNYIRRNIMPRIDASARSKLVGILNELSRINRQLDAILAEIINQQTVANELDRAWFKLLPHRTALEVMASWLRQNNLAGFSKLTLERLVVSAKVARVKQSFPIYNNQYLFINKSTLSLRD